MTSADDLYRQSRSSLEHLDLREIPFTESPIALDSATRQRIFTGRTQELKKVFNLFQGRERRRILVYGWIGIGKSAFILEVLGVLRRQEPEMLTTYITLPPDLDLATAALVSLALEMPDDDWAQRQLHQMGLPTDKLLKERSSEISGSMGIGGKIAEKDLPIVKPQFPSFSFDALLERALKKYPRGVVVAIDDLDKQDPGRVRQLLHDAQGLLKGPAWFLLTGHPSGITGDLLTTERGLFDLQLELKQLDPDATYQMLINYLNSARLHNSCTDPKDPRCVLPFLPETARRLCDVSRGHPRMFNRLGMAVLNTALELNAEIITPDVLEQGLMAANRKFEQQAALTVKEQMLLNLLRERGSLSDENVSFADLEQLGARTFSELMPMLDKLDQADLVRRQAGDRLTAYQPIQLLPGSDPPQEKT